jgi:hypothetical protein
MKQDLHQQNIQRILFLHKVAELSIEFLGIRLHNFRQLNNVIDSFAFEQILPEWIPRFEYPAVPVNFLLQGNILFLDELIELIFEV